MKQNKIYALYDEKDNILGSYTREELKKLLNKNKNAFDCMLSRIKKGTVNQVHCGDKLYKVYIYNADE